jgi:hypothetical protein
MRKRYLVMVTLGLLVIGGCSTANEENLGGPTPVVPKQAGDPEISGYAAATKHIADQSQKIRTTKGEAAKKP